MCYVLNFVKQFFHQVNECDLCMCRYTFVKAADLGESSTTQSKRASKRAREADNAQDRPFYKFI
jgi:hypothetical protein